MLYSFFSHFTGDDPEEDRHQKGMGWRVFIFVQTSKPFNSARPAMLYAYS